MIRLDITPIGKPRMVRSDKWKQRPAVLRYRAFADEMRSQVKGELEPVLKLTFHVPMPTSWSKRKKADMEGKPHQQKPDIDNMVKAVLDVLSAEDSYIYDVHARKFWAQTGAIEIDEPDTRL